MALYLKVCVYVRSSYLYLLCEAPALSDTNQRASERTSQMSTLLLWFLLLLLLFLYFQIVWRMSNGATFGEVEELKWLLLLVLVLALMMLPLPLAWPADWACRGRSVDG